MCGWVGGCAHARVCSAHCARALPFDVHACARVRVRLAQGPGALTMPSLQRAGSGSRCLAWGALPLRESLGFTGHCPSWPTVLSPRFGFPLCLPRLSSSRGARRSYCVWLCAVFVALARPGRRPRARPPRSLPPASASPVGGQRGLPCFFRRGDERVGEGGAVWGCGMRVASRSGFPVPLLTVC